MTFIDPHMHGRDGLERGKDTLEEVLLLAEQVGATAIFDMPNCNPELDTIDRVEDRLALADRVNSPVSYGVYMLMTKNPDQVKHAVETYRKSPEIVKKHGFRNSLGVVGFKLYAGHSTRDLGVTEFRDQENIYGTLVEAGFDGVLFVHAEKEKLMKPQLWDPKRPVTHAYARPPEAETVSALEQIYLAREAGFKGTLHIGHVSTPETVKLVNEMKDIKVTCGVTPHHLMFDYTMMEGPNGMIYKMNPPLRAPGTNGQMLDLAKQGKITFIETDHAPHTLKDKIEGHASGVPVLQAYPRFINWLKQRGLNSQQISDLTFNNIAKTFGLDIEQRNCSVTLYPQHRYEFDPFPRELF